MKKVFINLLAMICIISLSACSSQDSRKKTIETGGSQKEVKKVVTVFYPWMTCTDPSTTTDTLMEEAKKILEKKQNNIEVKLVSAGIKDNDKYISDTKSKISSGEQVDIFMCWASNYIDFNEAGFMLPLNKYVESSKDYIDNTYIPGLLDRTIKDGKLYAMPIMFGLNGLCYNKSILEKHNIKLKSDWTWDDFYNICKVVSKGDKILPDYGEGNFIFSETYINSFGVDYIDDKNHKANLTDPKIAEWLNFEQNIRKINAFGTPINDPLTLLKQYQYNELNNGNIAFLPMDITKYDYINYKTEYPNIDIINFPIDSQQGFYKSYCYSTWINNKSPVSEEAFEFIKILLSEELQDKIVNRMGYNPINIKVNKSMSSNISEDKNKLFDMIASRSNNYYRSPKERTASDVMYNSLSETVKSVNQVEIKDLLKINTEVEKVLK